MKPSHGGRASPQRKQLILVKSTCVPIEPHLASLKRPPPLTHTTDFIAQSAPWGCLRTLLYYTKYRKIGIAW